MTGLEKKALILTLFFFTLGIGARLYHTFGENNDPVSVMYGDSVVILQSSAELEDSSDSFTANNIVGTSEIVKIASKKADILIDINHANAEELIELKGVGPRLAQTIIKYRTKNGPFQLPNDLLQVKGIGKKKLQSIRNQITFVK